MSGKPVTTTHPGHYARFAIEPIDFIAANNIGFAAGNVIKYVCRHDAKDGLKDLHKARYYLDQIIERATPKPKPKRRKRRVKVVEKIVTVIREPTMREIAETLMRSTQQEIMANPGHTFRATTRWPD